MQKGFTLIELLVVIAIIAVLSVVVVLTLNPAELIRQARDSNRISDLNTTKSAISLFLADTASSTGLLGGTAANYNTCYVDSIQSGANGPTSTALCVVIFSKAPVPTIVASTTSALRRGVGGTGWIPINFSAVSSGAPIGALPVDPLDNDGIHYYVYRASSTASTFKLGVKTESTKYGNGGTADVASTDGGNDVNSYETGTDLSL